MLALRGRRGKRVRYPAGAVAEADEAFVLPRPLRKGVRFLISLGAGRIRFPESYRNGFRAAFMVATGLYGCSLAATRRASRRLEDCRRLRDRGRRVSGNAQTSEIRHSPAARPGRHDLTGGARYRGGASADRRTALGGDRHGCARSSGYDRGRSQGARSLRIWQHGSDLSLIERSGSVIRALRDNKVPSLPLFVGRDARRRRPTFYDEFSRCRSSAPASRPSCAWPGVAGICGSTTASS